MQITSTQTNETGTIKVLIFGESGVGKTTLAGTLNEPTLIISAEAGLLSLKGKKIDVIDLSLNDKGEVIPQEQRIARLGEVYAYLVTDEARKKYKTIFIDSLSEINGNLLAQLNVEFSDAKDTLKMYGELSKKMKSLVKSFRDLPYYSIIFTALSEADKDESGQRFIGPQLIGKFSTQVGAYFDEVLYLHVNRETGERVLVTEKSDNLLAKDRSGKLSKYEPADLGLIYKKIKGATNEVGASKS